MTSAVGGGTSVFGGAIPRHHGDAGVVTQPARNGVGGSISQPVEDKTTFQVDQDGAIGPPLAQRPVIRADNAWRFNGRQGQRPDDAQQGVSADWHPKFTGEPRPRSATESNPDLAHCFGQPPGASGVRRYSACKALGERAFGAGRLPAIEPPHQQGNTELMPKGGEVSRRLSVPALNHAADGATVRTTGTTSATICKNDKGTAAATLDLKHAATRKEREHLHAPPMWAIPGLLATAIQTIHANCARATEPRQDHLESDANRGGNPPSIPTDRKVL
nr:hypothetical protein [Azospirillum baldaniorum]